MAQRTESSSWWPVRIVAVFPCGTSLEREARLTVVTIRLSDRKLKRIQRKKYGNLQAKLFDSWGKYDNQ